MILMDPDIVADPDDLDKMREIAHWLPKTVIVAEHKLWPATTHHDDWVWAFGPVDNGKAVLTQEYHSLPDWVANGFTYWPRNVLDIALPHMPFFDPLTEDINLSRFARDNNVLMRAAPGIQVKHLHWNDGDDYMAWTSQP